MSDGVYFKQTSFKDNTNKFIKANEELLDESGQRATKDVLALAKTRVPRKDNTLTQSGKTERYSPVEHYVTFGNDGSEAKDYAAVQERGKRKNSRQFRTYTSPGTGAHFLEKAGDLINKSFPDYLRQAASKLGRRWKL